MASDAAVSRKLCGMILVAAPRPRNRRRHVASGGCAIVCLLRREDQFIWLALGFMIRELSRHDRGQRNGARLLILDRRLLTSRRLLETPPNDTQRPGWQVNIGPLQSRELPIAGRNSRSPALAAEPRQLRNILQVARVRRVSAAEARCPAPSITGCPRRFALYDAVTDSIVKHP